jgi:RNA polymerase sigma-70 factor (ECF subfamily)
MSAAFACVAAAWRAHEGELRRYLRHRPPEVATADDMLQDVFLKAMRQGQGFCTLDDPRAWLFQVARNALADRARAARPVEPLPEELDPAQLAAPEAEPTPIDALAECVTRVLGELAVEDASVLRACDLEGRTQRDFAQAQSLSLPAVKSRLLRARRRLRERLIRSCQVPFDIDGSVSGCVQRSASAG